ncbi:MAG: hypothetical protein IPJ41_16050 [Phycisphaerales bacterium]|nr:hypothetical protein [Phycisphaerales bacterium]
MRTAHKLMLIPLLGLAFVGVGFGSYYSVFLRHEKELKSRLMDYENRVNQWRTALDEKSTTEQRLRDFASSTLGFSAEVVDSRFRSALSRMARDAGLVSDDIVVTTQTARAIKNPAVDAKVEQFKAYSKADFVEASDLYIMDADVRGSGTFAAVTRLLALAQTQPWIWNVRGFSLKPRDATASSFEIRIDLSTAFMPDLAPAKPSENEGSTTQDPPIVDPPASQVVATSAIVRRNVFAPAPPEPTAVAIQKPAPNADPQHNPAPPPPPPPPPYHEWRLAGLSGSPAAGVLAWMLNTRTGAAVMLSPGQGVLDATLVKASDDSAVFQIGDSRYRLVLNETLAERHPVQ